VEAAVHTGQPSFEEFPAAMSGEVRCRLAVPLLTGERVIGSLCVGSQEQRRFSPDETTLLIRLGNQAAIAIENARLQAQAQQAATLEERERIARELHDSLGQTLNYLALKMDIIGEHLEAGRIAAAQVELERIRKATRDAAADVRESILGLRTSMSQEGDWVAALEWYLTQFSELNGIKTELAVGDGARVPLPLASEVQLVRIIQEALANIRKHAVASQVWVRLQAEARTEPGRSDGRLRVEVEDNGQGFDLSAVERRGGPYFGLLVMRERARILGGELRVDSTPGRGTRVFVSVPLAADKGEG
jgi:two-component system nitrate/nitrite sensor histidine kinase NarX